METHGLRCHAPQPALTAACRHDQSSAVCKRQALSWAARTHDGACCTTFQVNSTLAATLAARGLL